MLMSRQSQTCSQGGTCELLDGFALLVQLTLVLTALAALGIKRWRERPRRPVQIWALDVSKQFIGAGTIHFLNLGISYLAGRPTNGRPATNLCVWYFLSLMVDTTIGIAILWFWLRILEWTLVTFWNIRNLQHYGDTSSKMLFRQWVKQTAVFVLAEFLMKICIYGMFQAFPAIFDVGDWVLRLIGTSEDGHYQVVFVMFVFPLFMNAFQFCVIDTIIKGKQHHRDSSLLSSTTSKHRHAPSKKNESTTFLHSIIVIDQHNKQQHPHERSPLLPSA